MSVCVFVYIGKCVCVYVTEGVYECLCTWGRRWVGVSVCAFLHGKCVCVCLKAVEVNINSVLRTCCSFWLK